jgi:hypothetical protein
MPHKLSHSERILFINTLLQRGVPRWAATRNRFNFNGFYALSKTAEAVRIPPPHSYTPLKRGICLARTERRWERGVYATSTHDCQQATDTSNALLLSMLKRRERRERRAPLNTYEAGC